MNNQGKVNEIARKLGVILLKSGTKMLASAFDLKPEVFRNDQLVNLWIKYKLAPSLFDQKYYVIDEITWRLLIKYDWEAYQKEWVEDYYDCDNTAFSFASRMSTIYNLNTAGVARCDLYDPKTEKHLGGHLYNIILTKDDKGLKIIAYEAIKNIYTDFSNNMIIDNWKYGNPTWLYLF